LYEQALAERRRAVELSGNAPLFLAELGGTYAAAGKRDEALQILEQLKELSKSRYVMAYWFAADPQRLTGKGRPSIGWGKHFKSDRP
jgi:tetratricopeptide (TPR) repeat protein